MTADQIRIVRTVKGLDSGRGDGRIVIRTEHGKTLGFLVPVDVRLARDRDTVAAMARWRRKFMKYFFTQFEPTVERTAEWLEQRVLPDNTRVLFLLQTAEQKPVGNFGLCDMSEESAEMDNMLRGEKGGGPEFIFHSILSLACWSYFRMGLQRVTGHTFAGNRRMLQVTDKIGFVRSAVLDTVRTEERGEVRYELGRGSAPNEGKGAVVRVTLEKARFMELYPWACSDSWEPYGSAT